jgi:sulfatase modifying factor 1
MTNGAGGEESGTAPAVPCCSPSQSCAPSHTSDGVLAAGGPAASRPLSGTETARTRPRQGGFVTLAAGRFLMGTEDDEGFPDDMEGPVRLVEVKAFRMAKTTVTNRHFANFVADTGYVTDAERFGWSFVFHLLLAPTARRAVIEAHVAAAPWWLAVREATWASPEGPGSSTAGREDHPVVHVSHNDAAAYCGWSGTRLPTEAEWEYAARGGLEQAKYPWGDDLTPRGQHRCNIWQGTFPTVNTCQDGYLGTAPAKSFRPNGYGLYNVAGNVWEITADSWRDAAGHEQSGERVIRGGSYLCHDSYCNRYRVAARSRTTLDSTTGNTGFRVAAART